MGLDRPRVIPYRAPLGWQWQGVRPGPSLVSMRASFCPPVPATLRPRVAQPARGPCEAPTCPTPWWGPSVATRPHPGPPMIFPDVSRREPCVLKKTGRSGAKWGSTERCPGGPTPTRCPMVKRLHGVLDKYHIYLPSKFRVDRTRNGGVPIFNSSHCLGPPFSSAP